MKFPSILEKFNVKLRKDTKSECFLTEIWITSSSIFEFSRGVSLRA